MKRNTHAVGWKEERNEGRKELYKKKGGRKSNERDNCWKLVTGLGTSGRMCSKEL